MENMKKSPLDTGLKHKKTSPDIYSCFMVPKAGLEPAHPKAVDFESTASTNFATSAWRENCGKRRYYTCHLVRRNCYCWPMALSA